MYLYYCAGINSQSFAGRVGVDIRIAGADGSVTHVAGAGGNVQKFGGRGRDEENSPAQGSSLCSWSCLFLHFLINEIFFFLMFYREGICCCLVKQIPQASIVLLQRLLCEGSMQFLSSEKFYCLEIQAQFRLRD